jgi:hypothetical protein
MNIRSDPNLGCYQTGGRAFDLHKTWVPVKPSKYMGDVDTSSKFIDDNMLLISVAVPELASWIFRVSR